MIPDWEGYCAFRSTFARVMDERYHTLSWLDEQVLSGKVQFWGGENAALLTEIKHYPTGAKDIHAVIAAGDIAEILRIGLQRVEPYAREQGCIGATIESREGWAKALHPYGYAPFQLTVRKELGGRDGSE